MKYLRRSALLAVLTMIILPLSVLSKGKTEWQGYLIDRSCMKAVADASDPLDFVYHHTKDCVLMPQCVKKGFTLYLPEKKKWLNLDKKGSKLAERVIRKSKRDSAFYVKVKGKMTKSGELIAESILEIKQPKEHQK